VAPGSGLSDAAVGGIVAGVIIAALLVILLIVALKVPSIRAKVFPFLNRGPKIDKLRMTTTNTTTTTEESSSVSNGKWKSSVSNARITNV